MTRELLKLLRCPACNSGQLEWQEVSSTLFCTNCRIHFPIVDGIPVLFNQTSPLKEGDTLKISNPSPDNPDSYKKRQMDYYSEKEGNDDWWFEIDRPHNSGRAVEFVTYYPMEELRKNISLGELLNGSTILNVGCGTGLEAEYFYKFGCEIIGIDFSLSQLRGAKERIGRRRFSMHLLAGDIERIPLLSQSVDFALAYESLHHLPNPYHGFREMCRVARRGVILFEPRKSALRTLALRLGIAMHREVVGNIVMEMRESDLVAISREYGFSPLFIGRHIYKEFFRPPKIYRYFDNGFSFWLFRITFMSLNVLFGRFGNKLTYFALKDRVIE